jgi:hypothetical protein
MMSLVKSRFQCENCGGMYPSDQGLREHHRLSKRCRFLFVPQVVHKPSGRHRDRSEKYKRVFGERWEKSLIEANNPKKAGSMK